MAVLGFALVRFRLFDDVKNNVVWNETAKKLIY